MKRSSHDIERFRQAATFLIQTFALLARAQFCLRQKPREPASPLRPLNLFSGKKEKPPDFGWLFWSRLRGSNSLPPPWQGGALPDELNLHTHHRNDVIFGASDRNRTNDTRIFSPLLYQLSYRGKYGDPERARTVDL